LNDPEIDVPRAGIDIGQIEAHAWSPAFK